MKQRGSKKLLTLLIASLFWIGCIFASGVHADTQNRQLAFISDLHIGLGKDADGNWIPTDDFRWPNALRGLLENLSTEAEDNMDLIVVGDFLELWQLPEDIRCDSPDPNAGCTIDQLGDLTQRIVNGHGPAFDALKEFAARGENTLHIIPGNHDAALLQQSVWQIVFNAMGGDPEKVKLVADGVWKSVDERIVVEHGHQIGADVNKYKDWPTVTREIDGQTRIIRPWGELFVQTLFNEQEVNYPVIDNLSPVSAGARYRISDQGLWNSAKDIARFAYFNLWETSLQQKARFLGRRTDENNIPQWDLEIARGLGHQLIINSLPAGDPFRQQLLADNPQSNEVRQELDAMMADTTLTSDAELKQLCDMVVIYKAAPTCDNPTLGYTAQKLLHSRREIMKSHLDEISDQHKKMLIYIYGHTHQYEESWPVQVSSIRTVNILNTGAFQRLVDEKSFLEIAKQKNLSPAEALKTLSVDDLAPCYSVVTVDYDDIGRPSGTLKRWHMPEDENGKYVAVSDPACALEE